jgi:hypothetical protein
VSKACRDREGAQVNHDTNPLPSFFSAHFAAIQIGIFSLLYIKKDIHNLGEKKINWTLESSVCHGGTVYYIDLSREEEQKKRVMVET